MLSKLNVYQCVVGDIVTCSAQLMSKISGSIPKISVLCADQDCLLKVDAKLWTMYSQMFIPHGILNQDPYPEMQPILFSDIDSFAAEKNSATCCFLITNNIIDDFVKVIEKCKNNPEINTLVAVFVASNEDTQNVFQSINKSDISDKKYFIDISGKWDVYGG